MAILDTINQQAGGTGLGGTDYTFIDADTIQDAEGNSFRLEGFDAPEVEKWIKDRYQAGESGGIEATETISALANKFGYNNVKPVLNPDGTPKIGKFGRPIIDLVNNEGQSFKSKILESGMLGPSRYTNEIDTLTSELGQLRREQEALAGTQTDDDWSRGADYVQNAMNDIYRQNDVFRQTALDEQQLAAARAGGFGDFYARDNVQVRNYDRDINNNSLNPFSDSWEQGWIGVKESSFGMLNMLGETTGSEWLEDLGEAGVERARTQIQDYGTTLTDWNDIKDIGTTFEYLSNNMALSLPYMAISLGGALAAPLTGGASLAAPASVYAGQTWNEMEGDNKNAAIAIGSGIAQAALDRLGLGAIVKTGVAPTALLNQAVAELVKKGMTKAAAKQTVMAATRKEIAGFVGDAATVARRQLKAKQLFGSLAGKAAIGAGGEAATEALQEAVGYTGAHWKEGFDYDELTERMLAGAIAGGALGGLFTAPGSLYDAGAWADVAVRQAPAEASRLSQAAKHAEYEEKTYGRVQSLDELTAKARADAAQASHGSSFDEKIAADKRRKKDRTTSEVVFDTFAAAPSLWRGATRYIFTPRELDDRSRSLRVLADMFGGQLQRTFSGSSYENSKHHKVAVYRNMMDMPQQVYAQFNNGKIPNAKLRGEISADIYRKLKSAIDPDTKKFNPALIPDYRSTEGSAR